MTEIITPELLRSWLPCTNGYKRFCELFPEGTDLKTAVEELVADGHDDWGCWLFLRCLDKGLFAEYTAKGYRNAGSWNVGNRNVGNRNVGILNVGSRNVGSRNVGSSNVGNWNVGNRNVGHFNTTPPDTILVFNKPCSVEEWNRAEKPNFLYFDIAQWIYESDMSNEEKIANPKFSVTGGYLKEIDYKDAFKKSWDEAGEKERALIKKLPNFDAEIFFEISGIDLRGE